MGEYLMANTNQNERPVYMDMTFAFTAVIGAAGSTIGAAVENVRGYSKLSNMPEFATYAQAQDYADELNAKLGLTTLEAWKIVASTMR